MKAAEAQEELWEKSEPKVGLHSVALRNLQAAKARAPSENSQNWPELSLG